MKMYPLHKNYIIEYFTKSTFYSDVKTYLGSGLLARKKELFEGIIFGSGKL